MVLEIKCCSRILKYWPASKLFIGGYRRETRAPGPREETKRHNVAFSRGLLCQTLKIESLLNASRLPNTCYRGEVLLGDIFYLSLRFSPVAEGNEESLRSGAVFVGYTSLMCIFFSSSPFFFLEP